MSLAEMLLNGQEKGFYKFPNGSEPLITRKEIEVLLDYDVILIENDAVVVCDRVGPPRCTTCAVEF
jgi:hypothetical protein